MRTWLMILMLGGLAGCTDSETEPPIDAQMTDRGLDISQPDVGMSDGPLSVDLGPDLSLDLDLDLGPDASPPDPWARCAVTPSSRVAPALRVEGCTLIRQGTTVAPPRGVVVSGDSLWRDARTPLHEIAHYQQLAAAGYDLVFLLLSWEGIEPLQGAYNGAYQARICQQVDWAAEAGLEVVLAMHFEGWGIGAGGIGAPRWVTSIDEPSGAWQAFWDSAEHIAAFEAAWTRLLDTCVGSAGIVGIHPLAQPLGTGDLGPLIERLRAAAEQRFGPLILFFEPLASQPDWAPSGPDVVLAPGGTMAWSDWREIATQAQIPLFARAVEGVTPESLGQALAAVEAVGAGWAVWHDGFGGDAALRDEDGDPGPLWPVPIERPWPVGIAGRVIGFGPNESGWSLRWRADGRDAGLSRIALGGRSPDGATLDLGDEFEWFIEHDPVTDELLVFVQGVVGEVELRLEDE